MFTQPVSPPPPAGPQTSSAVLPSPARQSRLRGLSYLRNYTHNHLLSRDSHHSSSSGGSSGGSGSGSSNNNSGSGSSGASSPQAGGGLTRSVSYTPTTTTTRSAAASNANRLTLVGLSLEDTTQPARATRRNGTSSAPSASPIPEASDRSAITTANAAAADQTATIATATATASNPQAAPPAAETAATATEDQQQQAAMTRARTGEAASSGASDTAPSIRFSAYYDPRSTRPSLSFPPISRTLPSGSDVIRVGRYSERDSQSMANLPANLPSAAPVGFKSKVVSRRHCEFWYENGKWYIKDVKSSSGTFLNHIRLSPPSQESKAFPVNDGDIVQLGIDFKGGEEMIFRCVKMRLELNRGWQNKPNTFNMAAHKRLRTMATNGAASVSGPNSQDCSICLNSIAPCQSLFVAPCSHTWHFKCVRSLLTSPQYPIFICPNCRAGADLEADVEEPTEDWQQLDEFEVKDEAEAAASGQASPAATPPEPATATLQETDAMDLTVNISSPTSPAARSTTSHVISEPLPIRNPSSGAGRVVHLRENGTPSPPRTGAEGPITPRNDAGPWVFDGRAGRRPADPASEMRSLDAAADMDMVTHVPSDDSSSR